MALFRVGLARHCPTEADYRPCRIVIWRWLRRLERRLLCLIEAFQAGTLPPPGPHLPHRRRPPEPKADGPSDPAAQRPTTGRLVVVRRVGWFVDAITEIGFSTWMLRNWLGEPQVEDLVAQSPQAARLLRGLCRAMGLKPPDYLRRRPEPEPQSEPEPPPQGPPYSTRYPPPEGILAPGEVWIARHGIWLPERADRPPRVEHA